MRRVAVAAAVAVAVLAAGCASSARPRVSAAGKRTLVEEGRGPVVRLGLMAGLTDATGLAGVQLGYFSRQLGSGVMLDPVPFTSGAAETAALAAGQLGAAYVDPVAAVAAWQASDGKLRIVAGVASGGAELVVSKRITRAGQLAGTRLAAPAGSAQAAALRYWLHRLGVPAPAAGRSVAVSGAAAVAAFRAGKLTGAWEPAPFDAQMVADGGHVLVDEAGLWPGGRFATAVLVVTQQFLSAHLAEAEALLKGQVQANDLINTDRAAAQAAAGQELAALQNGETTAPETATLQAAGYSVTQVTPSAWEGMSTSAFEAYAALVIGDPSGGSCSTLIPTTGTSGSDALGTNWQAAVSGNVAVLGTAPALPGTAGADSLISDAVAYAARQPSSGTVTGLYVSLNCEYSTTSAGTAVPLLNGVEGIGTAGGLSVQGGLSCSDSGTVNKWEADAAGTFAGFTSSSLASGSPSWPSPACPVQEAFDSWPAMFTSVAYDAASDVTANFTASDGTAGQPYVLLGAPVKAGTQALAPSTGGEVPAGSTAGGGANPAAAGVSQATAGDPVNTENGDFTQSDTDVSVPTPGPSLDFSRTYDADLAQQETRTGMPGPLGYGWTDDSASSLTAAKPVPGDIYTLDGLATDTGMGGPAAQAAIGQPEKVYISGGNTYIADSAGNRILEVAGADQAQWGITMTQGDVYTIAGSPTGGAGGSASGTAASGFLLKDPGGVAMDSAGDLFIADTGNNLVLELAASATPWGAGYGKIPSSATAGDVYYVAGTGLAGPAATPRPPAHRT